MSPTNAQPADRDIRLLDWEDLGDHDWSATAPGGWALFYEGRRFSLLRGNSYNRPASTLTLTRRGKTPARLLGEGGFDRLAKRIGYAIEPQTGDADFDRRIYLATDHAELGGALAARPEARRAILDLLDLDVHAVGITAEGLTAHLRGSANPDDDGGGTLSNLALHLCALSDLWPDTPPPSATAAAGSMRRALSLAWFCVVAALVFGVWYFTRYETWDRELETFAETDWLGMGLLVAVAIGPYALLGGRRATSHKTLAGLVAAILALLPMSGPLRLIVVNHLHARGWALAPALPTALRPDPDRQYSKGLVLDATVEGVPIEQALTLDEGKLALEGRLCMAGVVIEGLRGLRYVKGMRTWTCRPGETSHVPPPLSPAKS
jgi:hypothetical protein